MSEAALPDTAARRIRFDTARVGTQARDWLALLKPRVISLVVFTGAAGMIMAPGAPQSFRGCRQYFLHLSGFRGRRGHQYVV
jgi:protoheme IX farnesyltransferase